MERQHLSQTKKAITPSNRESGIARNYTHPVEELQGAIGNRAVNQLIEKQAKQGRQKERFSVGDPSQSHLNNAPLITQQPIQAKALFRGLSHEFSSDLLSVQSGGNKLPEQVQQKMETAFGTDFSDVRIHKGKEAESIGAIAFTRGRNIHFAPSKYDLTNQSSQQVLAHELTHVVQQRAGLVPQPQGNGIPINDNSRFENEAEALATKVMQGEPVQVAGAANAGLQPQAEPGASQPVQRVTVEEGKKIFADLEEKNHQEREEKKKIDAKYEANKNEWQKKRAARLASQPLDQQQAPVDRTNQYLAKPNASEARKEYSNKDIKEWKELASEKPMKEQEEMKPDFSVISPFALNTEQAESTNLTEKSNLFSDFNFNELQNIEKVQEGNKGEVFILTDKQSRKLVVKFQNDNPKGAVIGTNILNLVGVTTPDINIPNKDLLNQMKSGIELSTQSNDINSRLLTLIQHKFTEKRKITENRRTLSRVSKKTKSEEYEHIIIQTLAPGISIGKMIDDNPIELLNALLNPQFQDDLGRIIAADQFVGNSDRVQGEVSEEGKQGWFNAGNLFIHKTENDFRVVGIDNDVQLSTIQEQEKGNLLGKISQFARIGSLAVSNKEEFKEEVNLIVTRILKEVGIKHKKYEVTNNIEKVKSFMNTIVENVGKGAIAALDILLENKNQLHKKGWKRNIINKAGGDENDLKEWKARKRKMIRLRKSSS